MARLFPASWPSWARHLASLFLLVLVGGGVGYFAGRQIAISFPGLEGPDLPRWSDAVALLLGAVLSIAAGWTAVVAMDAAALGRTLKLEGPAGPAEVRDTRLQALILALSGVIVALPPLLMFARVDSLPAMIVLVVLLAVHTALNLRLFRTVDELFRKTAIEAGAITFWLGQGVLFLWAAAERLSLAPPLTAWDIYVVVMAAYLVASSIVTIRRGLA